MQEQSASPAFPALLLRQAGAVVAGNALQFYDFLIYAYFAPQIGRSFFPDESDSDSLILVLATYGVGFLTRPLGGVVIGILGDIKGRKPAMLLSFALMGVAIAGLALTPSAASIGAAAPVLAILFRLLQGFALGGEVGPSSAWLMEAAPAGRRCLYVSLQFAGQWGAGLVAALTALVLVAALSPDALLAWGWRAAFLAGAAVVPVGLVARWQLPETLSESEHSAGDEARPIQVWAGLFGLMMLTGATVATYMVNYLAGLVPALGLAPGAAMGVAVASTLCGTLLAPVGGLLGDRLGRKRVMLAATALLLLIDYPCFLAIHALPSAWMLAVAAAVMASLVALAGPAILTLMMENLPPMFRSGGVGIIYGMAISVFGVTTQFIVTWLTEETGSPLAPALYLAAGLALGLVGMAAIRETAPLRGA